MWSSHPATSLITRAIINCGSTLASNGAVTLERITVTICNLASATYSTANELPVVGAISSFAASGGVLPLSFQVLLGVLSPAHRANSPMPSGAADGAGTLAGPPPRALSECSRPPPRWRCSPRATTTAVRSVGPRPAVQERTLWGCVALAGLVKDVSESSGEFVGCG